MCQTDVTFKVSMSSLLWALYSMETSDKYKEIGLINISLSGNLREPPWRHFQTRLPDVVVDDVTQKSPSDNPSFLQLEALKKTKQKKNECIKEKKKKTLCFALSHRAPK